MFNSELIENLKVEVRCRRSEDSILQNQISLLLNKLDALEKFLDIEFVSTVPSSKYYRNHKVTGTL